MKLGEQKPYVPVFVGSTFSDLHPWRRAVRDALAQLEAIVRGMEQFGSKPGSPVEECLQVVRSCKVYIGVFGMRYGTVPDGQERSMTHLEYDEAQRVGLPALIYIIDEENQPILPKHVETGPGAAKLASLKEELKKRHVVSFFTSPEDLRARILHDVPQLLKSIGAEVRGDVDTIEAATDSEVLRQFELLPKMFSGRSITIEFLASGDFRTAYPEACKVLGLEIGATVFDSVKSTSGGQLRVFGERDIALALCRLPRNAPVRVRAVTAFGVYKRIDWDDNGPVSTPDTEAGLVVKEILHAAPPTDDKEAGAKTAG